MAQGIDLVCVLTPELLTLLESAPGAPEVELLCECDAVEIRYDLFRDQAIWPDLASRVLALNRESSIIGTIRLVRDGGRYPDADASKRQKAWEVICARGQHPHWIDVELEALPDSEELIDLAHGCGAEIIVSKHDFNGVPSLEEMRAWSKLALEYCAQGFKVAATSKTVGDCKPLYQLAALTKDSFEWLASFAMGDLGRASRAYSLTCGANLCYVAIGQAVAAGQISALDMIELEECILDAGSEDEVKKWLEELPLEDKKIP